MKKFVIKGLGEWNKVGLAEILEFPSGSNGRVINFSLNVSDRIEVYASASEDMTDETLLASSDGIFEVQVSAQGNLYIQLRSKGKGTVCFLKTKTADHRVIQVSETKFTSIETRRRRNSDVDRMMMIMQLNEKRRDATMKAEIDGLRAENAAKAAAAEEVIEDATESVPDEVQATVSTSTRSGGEATADAPASDKNP